MESNEEITSYMQEARLIAESLIPEIVSDFRNRKGSSIEYGIRDYWSLYNDSIQQIVAKKIIRLILYIPLKDRGAFLGQIAFCRKSGDRCLFGYQDEDPFPDGKAPISEKMRWHGMSRSTLKITEGSNKEWDGPSKLLFEAMKAVMEELLPLTQHEIDQLHARETSRA
ncbi:hypothetical protein HYW94_03845 [Candidatus Uhrbacteria bacterium]|nr:hypothetical protein [Candidatus Uhrbacteria bacterium]